MCSADDTLSDLGRRFVRGAKNAALRASRWSNLKAGIAKTVATPADGRSRLANSFRELGPYAAIALILPGGSLIALALLSRRHGAGFTPWLGRGVVLVAVVAVSIILPGST